MKHPIRCSIFAAIFATSAAAQTKVSEIKVEADLTAIETYEAARAWKDLEIDLETALASRLVNQIADEDDEETAQINIDIDEVALANNFESSLGLGEWSLQGVVDIDMPDPSKNEHYKLSVMSNQFAAYYPQGTDAATVTVDSEVFYDAIIAAFADNVASKLD